MQVVRNLEWELKSLMLVDDSFAIWTFLTGLTLKTKTI